jgi:hypothetical protein
MDFASQNNRSNPQPAREYPRPGRPASAPSPTPPTEPASPQQPPKKSKKKLFTIIGIAILALIALGLTLWFTQRSAASTYNTQSYQAVFLSNNQVYFGKIKTIDKDVIRMEDVYYFQSNGEKTTEDSKASLIKLGNELHGPQNGMYISRSQVLFWEDLRDDGKVVQAIKQQK